MERDQSRLDNSQKQSFQSTVFQKENAVRGRWVGGHILYREFINNEIE